MERYTSATPCPYCNAVGGIPTSSRHRAMCSNCAWGEARADAKANLTDPNTGLRYDAPARCQRYR